jgi:hypothetical protein
MTRHHLFLAVNAVLAVVNTALFVIGGYALCVLLAVVFAVVAMHHHDRLSARV